MSGNQESNQRISIHFPDELKRGAYANTVNINFTREEFILDFILLAPGSASVTSRVVMHPFNVRRMLTALAENLKRYETQMGAAVSSPPSVQSFGNETQNK